MEEDQASMTWNVFLMGAEKDSSRADTFSVSEVEVSYAVQLYEVWSRCKLSLSEFEYYSERSIIKMSWIELTKMGKYNIELDKQS